MDYVQFRTSIRGFNKEDVVTFIDKFTKEKEAQIEALKEENEQLRTMLVWSAKKPATPKEEKTVAENVASELVDAIADTPVPEGIDAEAAVPAELDAPIDLPVDPQTNDALEQLRAELSAANERNAQLEQKLAALNDRNASLVSEQQSCGEMQAELNSLNDRNGALASEKELLEHRLAELTAQNNALLSEKDALTNALQQKRSEEAQGPDYAELELAAYRRAEETERLARERANRIYAEIEEALNNGSRQSEIDTNELLEIARSVNDDVAKLQEKVGTFRENYRAIGDTLREVGNKP